MSGATDVCVRSAKHRCPGARFETLAHRNRFDPDIPAIGTAVLIRDRTRPVAINCLSPAIARSQAGPLP